MKDIVVFYHGLCRDGFTAAWAAHKKFGDKAEYIPLIWSSLKLDQIPSVKDKDVYFLDFTPTEKELSRVLKESKSVTVIDHHISKEALIKTLPSSVYDVSHSGAVLAWKYFHPDTKVPELCLYVEDSDIWKWEMPDSKEILSYIELKREFDFKNWDSMAGDLENEEKKKEYVEKGKLLVAFKEKIVNEIIKEHFQLVNFEGYEIYAINAPRLFRSEIGAKLAEMKPPFGIVWSYTTDEISFSLRAIQDDFDLIPVVNKFGGGGHKQAVNFRLPLGASLPWKPVRSLTRTKGANPKDLG